MLPIRTAPAIAQPECTATSTTSAADAPDATQVTDSLATAQPLVSSVTNGTLHRLNMTEGPVVHHKARHLSAHTLQAVKLIVQELLDNGILQ